MKLATIFSGGLAAPEWALKYLGIEHETVFAAEIDKFARQMYLANHGEPTSQFYNDVCQIDGKKYKGQIDMFVGGSPCQAFSIAGNRGGFSDTRGTLFYEYVRLVKEIQPRYFIFENVKGLLNHDKGRTWKTILNAFEDVGYLFAHKVMNAKKHGTPQNRERVFVVGFRDEEDYHKFSFPEEIPLTQTLGDVLDSEVEEKYYLNKKMIDSFTNSFFNQEKNRLQKKEIVDTILSIDYKSPKLVGMLDMKGNDETRRVYGQNGCAPCLSTMQGGMRQPKIKAYLTPFREEKRQNGRREKDNGEPMFTLTAQDIHGVSIDDGQNYRIRKLTPRECFRLMGDYKDRVKIVVSDSQAYKCAGNGIEIRTMMALIKSIVEPKRNGLF